MLLKLQEDNSWKEVSEGEQYDIAIDGFLRKKLDNIKFVQSKNWDGVFVICGREGSGKSTLSFICGQYLTKMKLQLDDITEGSDDTIKKLKDKPDESILIIDEGELILSSRETMTKEQRKLTTILKVIRQKRMILIIVCPSFFDLSRYAAIDRSRFVIRTYTDPKLERGYYMYWGQKRKDKLYKEGKKNEGSYNKPKSNFFGRFVNYIPPWNDEYKKLKARTLNTAFDPSKKEPKIIVQSEESKKEKVLRLVKYIPNLTIGQISGATGVDRAYVRQILPDFPD